MTGVGQPETEGNGRGYLAERGWRSWAFTLDHKRIGAMYLWTTTFFFLVGGVFARAHDVRPRRAADDVATCSCPRRASAPWRV